MTKNHQEITKQHESLKGKRDVLRVRSISQVSAKQNTIYLISRHFPTIIKQREKLNEKKKRITL